MSYDLTNLPTPVVIFEIDDNSFHGHAKFARHLDTLMAMGTIRDKPEIGMGYWMGEHNVCYVMAFDDLHVVAPYIHHQDAIVYVDKNADAELLDGENFTHVLGRGKMERPFNTGGLVGYTVLKSGIFTADFT